MFERRWEQKDIDFLEKNCCKYTIYELCSLLNRTKYAVRYRLQVQKLKCKPMKLNFFTKNKQNKILVDFIKENCDLQIKDFHKLYIKQFNSHVSLNKMKDMLKQFNYIVGVKKGRFIIIEKLKEVEKFINENKQYSYFALKAMIKKIYGDQYTYLIKKVYCPQMNIGIKKINENDSIDIIKVKDFLQKLNKLLREKAPNTEKILLKKANRRSKNEIRIK